jgi:hypothetical protein
MLSFRSAGRFCPRGRSLLPSPLSGSTPHYSLLLTCLYPCLLLFSLLLSSKRTTTRGRSTMRSEARGPPRDRPAGDHLKARRLRPAVKGSRTHRARRGGALRQACPGQIPTTAASDDSSVSKFFRHTSFKTFCSNFLDKFLLRFFIKLFQKNCSGFLSDGEIWTAHGGVNPFGLVVRQGDR